MRLSLHGDDDLKEIVFENRNKAYGAYQLRTGYHRTLNRAMIITLFSFGIFTSLLIFLNNLTKVPDIANIMKKDTLMFTDVVLTIPESKLDEKQPVTQSSQPSALEHTYKVVDKVKPDDVITTSNPAPDPLANTGPGIGPADLPTGIPAGGPVDPTTTAAPAFALAAVDVSPEFPGGLEKFYKYLLKKLHFTEAANRANLSGKFYATFVIDPEGKLVSVNLPKQIGYGMDELVVSILNKSPAWKPGYFQGQPVSTMINLPINFTMLQ